MQVDAEAPEKVPALQFPQVELPCKEANLPAAQVPHAELLFLSEYVPRLHKMQREFKVRLEKEPARQVLHWLLPGTSA